MRIFTHLHSCIVSLPLSPLSGALSLGMHRACSSSRECNFFAIGQSSLANLLANPPPPHHPPLTIPPFSQPHSLPQHHIFLRHHLYSHHLSYPSLSYFSSLSFISSVPHWFPSFWKSVNSTFIGSTLIESITTSQPLLKFLLSYYNPFIP